MRISDWSSDVCSSDLRTTAGKPDRYDVTLDEGGKTAMLRIDGTGHALRYRAPDERFGDGGVFVFVYDLHESLLSGARGEWRSEEHTSELQSLMRISYAVFCLKKKQQN